ncbi:MAG TPA: hypothetical protein VFI15_11820, partial [Candidatus Limnocylindrales bacterium]|nr:hypothetical protein [Candidatus Limnocylindrales bacterium]
MVAGALIALVIVGGLVALALRHPAAPSGIAVGSNAPPTVAGAAPSSGDPSIDATPERSDPWDMRRVDVPLSSVTTTVREIWSVGGSFIALVDDFAVDDGPASVFLQSTDGTEWAEVAPPDDGLTVAAGSLVGDELWLVGSTGGPDARKWHIWSTPDGRAWTDRGSVRGLVPANGILMDFAAGASGFVATVAAPPVDQDHPGVEQVRYSADGRLWERVALPEVDPSTHLVGLTQTDAGWLLAADIGEDSASYELRILASVDGRSWSSTAVAANGEGLAVTLANGPSGYVLGGADAGPSAPLPVVWTSTDGERWARVGLDVPPGQDGGVIVGVLSTERGYVVVGNRGGDAW